MCGRAEIGPDWSLEWSNISASKRLSGVSEPQSGPWCRGATGRASLTQPSRIRIAPLEIRLRMGSGGGDAPAFVCTSRSGGFGLDIGSVRCSSNFASARSGLFGLITRAPPVAGNPACLTGTASAHKSLSPHAEPRVSPGVLRRSLDGGRP